ncbi:MAG: hypothetical protein ABIV28_09020, partial [Longimicrobiales bacterium]
MNVFAVTWATYLGDGGGVDEARSGSIAAALPSNAMRKGGPMSGLSRIANVYGTAFVCVLLFAAGCGDKAPQAAPEAATSPDDRGATFAQDSMRDW